MRVLNLFDFRLFFLLKQLQYLNVLILKQVNRNFKRLFQ